MSDDVWFLLVFQFLNHEKLIALYSQPTAFTPHLSSSKITQNNQNLHSESFKPVC